MTTTLCVLGLILLLSGCAVTQEKQGTGGDFTQHYSDTLFEVTGNGLYSVELLMEQGTLVTGENSFQTVVHDPQDKDVPGAVVKATAFKPQSPDVTRQSVQGVDREGGLYSFKGLEIKTPGEWKLMVEVNKAGQRGTVEFSFPEVSAPTMESMNSMDQSMEGQAHDHGAGQMHHHAQTMERPEHIDTSTEVMSQDGEFKVGYDTEVKPIPIGRIHRWRVRVLDAAGQPVTSARILISGDMPEHGHGLPTDPEVTKHIGDGVYEIEGMRFSMPGWWVINFQILTMDTRDTATFNLLLE